MQHSTPRNLGIRPLIAVLLMAGTGPAIGLLMAMAGLVLTPPRTWSSGLLYLAPLLLCVPLGIMAVVRRWFKVWILLLALVLAGMVAVVYLAILGPWLPGGMTTCEPADAAPGHVRYTCVTGSSDNADYEMAFGLAGRARWPVVRMVRGSRRVETGWGEW